MRKLLWTLYWRGTKQFRERIETELQPANTKPAVSDKERIGPQNVLWQGLRDHHGFTGFARLAAPQLIRWEQEHGWTRSGWGRLSENETTLATVLRGMLRGGDADHLLDRLVTHPQLAGPELTYLQARRAIQTGAPDRARA